jgi:hypothetical protein
VQEPFGRPGERVGSTYSGEWDNESGYAHPVLPSVIDTLVRVLLDLLVVRARPVAARDVEALALRHEVRVQRRTAARARWQPSGRVRGVSAEERAGGPG